MPVTKPDCLCRELAPPFLESILTYILGVADEVEVTARIQADFVQGKPRARRKSLIVCSPSDCLVILSRCFLGCLFSLIGMTRLLRVVAGGRGELW